MKTKSIDEITKELEDKKAETEAEVKDLDLKIEMQNTAVREHEKEMAAASDAGNVGEYVAAKKELQAAEDVREMYQKRHDKLTIAPQITEAEYSETIREIESAAGAKVAKITEDVNKVFDDLTPYYNELRENVEKVNTALQIAFTMCFPGDHQKKKDGSIAIPEKYHGHNELMIRIKRATGRENEKDF